MNLIDAASKYAHGAVVLKEWIGEGGISVDQHTAQARANTCLLCPKNSDGLKLAESAIKAIREQVELKNNIKLRVIGERNLKTCAACLCPLSLKVWIPIENISLSTEEYGEYWENCWLVKESKALCES